MSRVHKPDHGMIDLAREQLGVDEAWLGVAVGGRDWDSRRRQNGRRVLEIGWHINPEKAVLLLKGVGVDPNARRVDILVLQHRGDMGADAVRSELPAMVGAFHMSVFEAPG